MNYEGRSKRDRMIEREREGEKGSELGTLEWVQRAYLTRGCPTDQTQFSFRIQPDP